VFLVFDGEKLSSMTDKGAVDLLKPYAGFMGKVRAALKKPRLPFLVVVTKMDKVQAADTKARDDELDVHFVRYYTREELDHNTKVPTAAAPSAVRARASSTAAGRAESCTRPRTRPPARSRARGAIHEIEIESRCRGVVVTRY
jgi:hypothetical protein